MDQQYLLMVKLIFLQPKAEQASQLIQNYGENFLAVGHLWSMMINRL